MITALYAGILGLIFVGLSFNVIMRRIRLRALFGDAGNPDLNVAVRMHGNFAEYVPFILLAMVILEMTNTSLYTIHVMGIVLIVARIVHALGLYTAVAPARIAGTVLTQTTMIVASILLILKGIGAMSTL